MRRLMMLAVSAFLALTFGSTAKADTLERYPSGVSFPSTDFIHWTQLGATGTIVATPYAVTTDNNFPGITLYTANGGSVERLTECPAAGCDWAGNFAPGAALLGTNPNFTGTGNGPLTFTFSTPISGIGFEIQPDYYGSFIGAELELYDGSTFLGDETRLGSSNGDENGTAIFLGLVDLSGANITSAKLGTYDCALNCGDFAIDWVNLDTSSAPVVPEPGTLMLLSSGFGVLGLLRRKLS